MQELANVITSETIPNTISLIVLRYSYDAHKFVIVVFTNDTDKPFDEKAFIDNDNSKYIYSWVIDQNRLKDIDQKYELITKCYIAIVNSELSPNDYQLNGTTPKQQDVIFKEIMRDLFQNGIRVIQDKEDFDPALLELNHNPKIREVISELYDKKIDLERARQKIMAYNYEMEHLSYIFGILEDKFNVTTLDHQVVNK